MEITFGISKFIRTQIYIIVFFPILFLLFTFQSFGQNEKYQINVPFDSITQKYTYVRIIEVPDRTKSDLYRLAKDWTQQKYLDDKYLIDTENEQLIDLGNFTINVAFKSGMVTIPMYYTVIFNLNFYFKDGRCKFEITNIKLSQNSQGLSQEVNIEAFKKQNESMTINKNMGKRLVADVFNEIDVNMLKIILEIESGLKNGIRNQSDW